VWDYRRKKGGEAFAPGKTRARSETTRGVRERVQAAKKKKNGKRARKLQNVKEQVTGRKRNARRSSFVQGGVLPVQEKRRFKKRPCGRQKQIALWFFTKVGRGAVGSGNFK